MDRICDICLIKADCKLIGFYVDEEDNIHLNQNSLICKKCLGQVKAEIVGTRVIRRMETAPARYYKRN